MTLGQTYAGQQPRATNLKNRLQNTLENIDDPQVLAGLNHLVNSYLKQIKIQQQELSAAQMRYNSMNQADRERTIFAHSWLERKNPLFYAANSQRSNLDY